MARNTEKDAREMAERRQRILASGLREFSAKTIEKVTMNDVAQAAGIGIATLYRYYSTKTALVIGIGTWIWQEYIRENGIRTDGTEQTAAQLLARYLESFLDLYRNHPDILRFNQFFNVYVQSEDIPAEEMDPYNHMIGVLSKGFHRIYLLGEQDGTLRKDLSEGEMFSAVTHLMLAAVTRYAVGLIYKSRKDPERELLLLKDLLLQYCSTIPAPD